MLLIQALSVHQCSLLHVCLVQVIIVPWGISPTQSSFMYKLCLYASYVLWIMLLVRNKNLEDHWSCDHWDRPVSHVGWSWWVNIRCFKLQPQCRHSTSMILLHVSYLRWILQWSTLLCWYWVVSYLSIEIDLMFLRVGIWLGLLNVKMVEYYIYGRSGCLNMFSYVQ